MKSLAVLPPLSFFFLLLSPCESVSCLTYMEEICGSDVPCHAQNRQFSSPTGLSSPELRALFIVSSLTTLDCDNRGGDLFTDIFWTYCIPSVFDTQRLCASPVWLLYNLRPIARIDTAIGVYLLFY